MFSWHSVGRRSDGAATPDNTGPCCTAIQCLYVSMRLIRVPVMTTRMLPMVVNVAHNLQQALWLIVMLGVAKAACAFHAEPAFKHMSVRQHELYKQRRCNHALFVLISQWSPSANDPLSFGSYSGPLYVELMKPRCYR